MTEHEMEGFLRGKCLPRDIHVNESTAQYLVRKLAERDADKRRIAELEETADLQRDKIKRLESDLWDEQQLRKVHSQKSFELESENRELKQRNDKDFVWRGEEIGRLNDEIDALREGEMGDAKHSNTRAAADIYFQLVEECEIPAGGSLVEHVDDMRQRIAELEIRISQQRSIAAHNLDMFRRADARIAELEARTLTVKMPQGYVIRAGHPINEGERHVMVPKDGGDWLSSFDVELALLRAGISLKIEGE